MGLGPKEATGKAAGGTGGGRAPQSEGQAVRRAELWMQVAAGPAVENEGVINLLLLIWQLSRSEGSRGNSGDLRREV